MKKIKLTNPPTNSSSSSANILHVKFVSHLCKEKIIKAKRGKKEQFTTNLLNAQARSEKVFINECLSYQRRQLLNTAMSMKATKGYKYVWPKNGTICMRKKEGDSFVRVNCAANFVKI